MKEIFCYTYDTTVNGSGPPLTEKTYTGHTEDPDWTPTSPTGETLISGSFKYTMICPLPAQVTVTQAQVNQKQVTCDGGAVKSVSAWSSGDPIVTTDTFDFTVNRFFTLFEFNTDENNNDWITVSCDICYFNGSEDVVVGVVTTDWNVPPGVGYRPLKPYTLLLASQGGINLFFKITVSSKSTAAFKWAVNVMSEIHDPLKTALTSA